MVLSNSAEGNDDDELSYVGVPSDLKGTQAQTIKLFAGWGARGFYSQVYCLCVRTVLSDCAWTNISNPFYGRGERLWPGDRLNG